MDILYTRNPKFCLSKYKKKRNQTNKKFKSFDHMLFTMGDLNDFSFHVILRLMLLLKTFQFIDLRETFHYIFFVLKKGNICLMKNNKVEFFLPFSNYYFQSPVLKYLSLDEEDKKELELLEKYRKQNLKNQYFKLEKRNNRYVYKLLSENKQLYNRYFERRKWVVNGCFFRNERYEGDKYYNLYHHFFYHYSKHSTISKNKNILYFFNIRDFPMVRKNQTYPYHNIVSDLYLPYKTNFPVLSLCTTDNHKDIPMPTPDDLRFIYDDVLFPPQHCVYIEKKDKLELKWENKTSKVCFRGSATGCGISVETNMRLKAFYIGQKYPELFDIGITNPNSRLKKYSQKRPITFLKDFTVSSKLNNYEQSTYKFLLVLEGHVAAFRLSYQMYMNSCILLQDSEYQLWYSHLLVPYKHFVPIKRDLSDLVEKTEWCLKNDDKCKTIAYTGYQKIQKILTKKFIYEYMDFILNKYCIFTPPKPIKLENKIALITIYRDNSHGNRSKQKKVFLEYYSKVHPEIDIFVIEQSSKHAFNIGLLKNIGFSLAKNKNKNKYDYYVFSDIDLLPDDELSWYYYKKFSDSFPISLAHRGTLYENYRFSDYVKYYEYQDFIPYTHFIGGLNIFDSQTFEKINGYPNHFWGWGGEDIILLFRLNQNNLKLYYPKKGRVVDIENNIDIKAKMVTLKTTNEEKESLRYEKMNEYFSNNNENLKNDGLSSIDSMYKIVSKKENHYIVELNPINFPFSSENNNKSYKEIKKINSDFVKLTVNKIPIIYC